MILLDGPVLPLLSAPHEVLPVRVTDVRIPLRFLRGSGRRMSLTVAALACGVAMVSAIDLVNAAVLRAFTEVIDTMAGRAALSITAGEEGVFPGSSPHGWPRRRAWSSPCRWSARVRSPPTRAGSS